MARVGQERARIGDHADEFAEDGQVAQRLHLLAHAVEVVVEPPAGAELDLAGRVGVLEVAEHGAEHIVILGVEREQNRLGQQVLIRQTVQKTRQRRGDLLIVQRVEARVRTDRLKHLFVIVAHGADVQLHRPAAARVFPGERREQRGAVLIGLLDGERFARFALLEDGFDLLRRCFGIGDVRERVVAALAAVFGEERDALQQGCFQLGVGVDAAPDARFQTLEPRDERGQFDAQRLVGAERRHDLGFEALVLGEELVVFQRIRGVVRGEYAHDVGFFDQLARFEAAHGDHGVRLRPDLFRRFGRERRVDVEKALQLQMRPVIQRVTHGVGQHFSIRHEFIVPARIARDVLFLDAERAHGAPFVVVAAEHEPGDVFRLLVFVNLFRRQMTMPVEDRHSVGGGEQFARRGVVKQEILIHKLFHTKYLLIFRR